jgi:hypothetical protein
MSTIGLDFNGKRMLPIGSKYSMIDRCLDWAGGIWIDAWEG